MDWGFTPPVGEALYYDSISVEWIMRMLSSSKKKKNSKWIESALLSTINMFSFLRKMLNVLCTYTNK